MKQVQELSGAELDYWVAKAQGCCPEITEEECWIVKHNSSTATPFWDSSTTASWETRSTKGIRYQPSQDWFDGGPLIERFEVSIHLEEVPEPPLWSAYIDGNPYRSGGTTPLQATMRAILLSQFGEEVSELVK
jgi:hypothetical protein